MEFVSKQEVLNILASMAETYNSSSNEPNGFDAVYSSAALWEAHNYIQDYVKGITANITVGVANGVSSNN